ncbi:MAG: hypothetical protein GY804_08610 [Alphaproteobacteria bacterium]|nr:hypothetical protein [Alphaproteobacteria bacterium]
MGIIETSEPHVGNRVSFQTNHPNDSQTYIGTIFAIGDWQLSLLDDSEITSDAGLYHMEITKVHSEIDINYKNLQFFVMKLDDSLGPGTNMAVCYDWIESSSWNILDISTDFYMVCPGIAETEHKLQIMNTIRALGYSISEYHPV